MIEWLITSQCTTHEQCNLDAIGTSTKKQPKTTDSCRDTSEVNSFNIIPSLTVHSVTEKNSMISAKKNISKPTLQPAACHDELVKAIKKKKTSKMTCCTQTRSRSAVSETCLRHGVRNPALCGSCPLVTQYYCRLGDLLCYNCMLYLSYHFVCMHVYFVFSLFSELFYFVDLPSVIWYCWLGLLTCKNRLPYNL